MKPVSDSIVSLEQRCNESRMYVKYYDNLVKVECLELSRDKIRNIFGIFVEPSDIKYDIKQVLNYD